MAREGNGLCLIGLSGGNGGDEGEDEAGVLGEIRLLLFYNGRVSEGLIFPFGFELSWIDLIRGVFRRGLLKGGLICTRTVTCMISLRFTFYAGGRFLGFTVGVCGFLGISGMVCVWMDGWIDGGKKSGL